MTAIFLGFVVLIGFILISGPLGIVVAGLALGALVQRVREAERDDEQ